MRGKSVRVGLRLVLQELDVGLTNVIAPSSANLVQVSILGLSSDGPLLTSQTSSWNGPLVLVVSI